MSDETTLARVHRWIAPAVGPAPLAWVRIAVLGFGCVWLLSVAPGLVTRARLPPARFSPVGLSHLTGPVSPTLVIVTLVAVMLVGLAALAGRRYRVTAPAFALGLTWLLSYRNSWGHMSHSEHLLVLHTCVIALAPAADALRLRAPAPDRAPHSRYGWPLRLMMAITATTYVVAGLAKINTGGAAWLTGESVRLHVATEVLRNLRVGMDPAALGQWLLPHPAVFTAMAIGTVAIELGSPISMLRGMPRHVWLVGVWSMHLGIWLVMGIGFPYPLSGVAFAAHLPLDDVARRVVDAWRRRGGSA